MATGLQIESSIPNASDLHEIIRRRAEEIYYRSGCVPGRDVENWAQAEKEIREGISARATRTTHRTAVLIKVNDVLYVGEYSIGTCDGYTAGEFTKGTPVTVRFDGDKMFVKRPNGRELKTTIVEKTVTNIS